MHKRTRPRKDHAAQKQQKNYRCCMSTVLCEPSRILQATRCGQPRERYRELLQGASICSGGFRSTWRAAPLGRIRVDVCLTPHMRTDRILGYRKASSAEFLTICLAHFSKASESSNNSVFLPNNQSFLTHCSCAAHQQGTHQREWHHIRASLANGSSLYQLHR